MQLEKFISDMKYSILNKNRLTKKVFKSIIRRICNYNRNKTLPESAMSFIIMAEELAELQKECTKFLRFKGNRYAIMEEMADVIIYMESIKTILDISKEEMDNAVLVKLKNFDPERISDN